MLITKKRINEIGKYIAPFKKKECLYKQWRVKSNIRKQ